MPLSFYSQHVKIQSYLICHEQTDIDLRPGKLADFLIAASFSLSQWLVMHMQVHTVAYKSHVIASSVAWCRFLSEQIIVQSPHSDVTGACDVTCPHIIQNVKVLLFDVDTHPWH
jgi:hypothetical protein